MFVTITAEVLVVGGGTGGTAAAIQAARRGAQTVLVSAGPWLGGMLTAAGVAAPDGNELVALRTGIWGAYLQALRQRQVGGLDWSWVSLFAYDPRVGAQIFADWVQALPNLRWLVGQVPLEVQRVGDRLASVRFPDYEIRADVILDGTELGDLLALGDVPHRWGWEWQAEFDEPSAPVAANELTERYPVQAPTWVAILQDYGEIAPAIAAPPTADPNCFTGAWDGYGGEPFLHYGRLSSDLFMLNWPQQGNDWGDRLDRLLTSEAARREWQQEARWHSQAFARYIQENLGSRYGLASAVFPDPASPGLALQAYYRESRRLRGLATVTERDILPRAGGQVAALPMNKQGEMSAIALGNYPNDHHYPGVEFPLAPKSMRWGGRWTGTPFAIPYEALIPATVDGLLACEKNISVSHIANGATRLQPIVMGIGQAAGMAAALCVEQGCQPRELSVRALQAALLTDPDAPAAIIPLLNLPPEHPQWVQWQCEYGDRPDTYPLDGNCPCDSNFSSEVAVGHFYTGYFSASEAGDYRLDLTDSSAPKRHWSLITARPEVARRLADFPNGKTLGVWAYPNAAGGWLLAEKLQLG
ncbi:MAG: FAD-dependent oxidoreductase [Spirulinaceae cyanobacterium RM2_2_10]|nr:FAD-dependent oxidoreductase [Spirulinaceae cyanobacterium SM2_1_0]NJO20193.1 FAD-dependent oxidoreductase [Spirulinaceae cyanobacterium RM2_2_10]